jgi:hypothetical protein
MNENHGTVVSEKYFCKNPACEKALLVYWFASLEYYNTM